MWQAQYTKLYGWISEQAWNSKPKSLNQKNPQPKNKTLNQSCRHGVALLGLTPQRQPQDPKLKYETLLYKSVSFMSNVKNHAQT